MISWSFLHQVEPINNIIIINNVIINKGSASTAQIMISATQWNKRTICVNLGCQMPIQCFQFLTFLRVAVSIKCCKWNKCKEMLCCSYLPAFLLLYPLSLQMNKNEVTNAAKFIFINVVNKRQFWYLKAKINAHWLHWEKVHMCLTLMFNLWFAPGFYNLPAQ